MKLLDIPVLKEIIVNKSAIIPLNTALQNARAEWQQALKEMDYIDDDLVDYVIFKINAAEKRYIALLEQAKKEQLVAWEYLDLASPTGEETTEELCNTGVENAPA